MKYIFRAVMLWFALSTGMAMAQADPSMADIYAAAQAGQMDKAQSMIQQVLISHPNSAKAHFVRAELFAKEGNYRLAQESLNDAERLSPGLHFAKPESVNALKAQIAGLRSSPLAGQSRAHAPSFVSVQGDSGANGLLLLLVAGGVITAGYFLFRNRKPRVAAASYTVPLHPSTVVSGPQTFGGNPASGYPAPAPEPGMGSRIIGGVATGLAVGAGVMAAEAIGRRLMDHGETSARRRDEVSDLTGSDFSSISVNTDMGGANFGIADGDWDDAGGSASSSDWDG